MTMRGKNPWNKSRSRGYIQNGYRRISALRGGRRVVMFEHRWVMEQHLGRFLEPDEIVHHKDGNKLNNEISNLEIMTPGQHSSHHSKGRPISPAIKGMQSCIASCKERIRDLEDRRSETHSVAKELLEMWKKKEPRTRSEKILAAIVIGDLTKIEVLLRPDVFVREQRNSPK